MTDYKTLLQQANDALARAQSARGAQLNEDRNRMMAMFGSDIVAALKPAIESLVAKSTFSKEELLNAISNIQVHVPSISVPKASVEVKVADIPTPIVNVTVPEVKIPAIKMPEIKMPEIGMKETNAVLKTILDELKKEEKVSVNLKII